MTVLLPRLDREQVEAHIEHARSASVQQISEWMPLGGLVTTAPALGGTEMDESRLKSLRGEIVDLAGEHGFPSRHRELSVFDGRCARALHAALPISPHEAAEEGVWSYLTVGWLLDVAVWRWNGVGDPRRFYGDINRNTFRRLWWRTEILGRELDLTQLGEDELVNIMERPTIASNRRLARSLAHAFLRLVRERDDIPRMAVMREAGKRLIRLTPIMDFHSLEDCELNDLLKVVLEVSITGGPLPPPCWTVGEEAPRVSGSVELVSAGPPPRDTTTPDQRACSGEHHAIALDIARRAGRITNATLRDSLGIDAQDARRILRELVERGELRRLGQTRGSHYVLASESSLERRPDAPGPPAPSWRPAEPAHMTPQGRS